MSTLSTRQTSAGPEQSRAFTLIELLVAMAVGVVVLGALVTLLVETNQANRVSNGVARMQENARFALDLMAREIKASTLQHCSAFDNRYPENGVNTGRALRVHFAGAMPHGFVANDYGLSIWCGRDLSQMIASGQLEIATLFGVDMLGDDLDAWLSESSLMKRTFRQAAVVAGLIERRHPGREKSGRQVTMSTDLIYDVLRRHDPGHILLEAAWADAASGLLDIGRLGEFLSRIQGRIMHVPLLRVSPLSVPILLEIGRETVAHSARENVLREASEALIREASI